MVVVTGVIVIVLVVVLAVVGGSTSAKTVSIAEAATGQYADQRIQVSGNVVENSFSTEGNVLTFDIYDPDGNASEQLRVRYDGGVSATFGNDVTAICTGKMGADGVLLASELVTKCPSKYENATDALDVAQLVGYGKDIEGKPVKVTGTVKAGSLAAAGQGDRLVLASFPRKWPKGRRWWSRGPCRPMANSRPRTWRWKDSVQGGAPARAAFERRRGPHGGRRLGRTNLCR